MTLYAIQNKESKYLLEFSTEGLMFTPKIPFRQLIDTEKQANQVAVKWSRRKPELKDQLTIVPVVLSFGEAIEVVYPPKKDEE
jgi:hypothetical protein